jgi:hypothetical protein
MPRHATAVRLLQKVKVGADWRFTPVAFSKNGKIRADGPLSGGCQKGIDARTKILAFLGAF